MQKKNVIKHVATLVEHACKQKNNISGYQAWTHHISVVVKFAKQLAHKLGAHEEIVELAALLHDYAKIVDPALSKEHNIHGARIAQELLAPLGYPQEKLDLIKQAIISHRGDFDLTNATPEEICLASADGMSHIDQALYLLTWACKGKNLGVQESLDWLDKKLDRTWKKLCPEAQEMMREKFLCLKKLLR